MADLTWLSAMLRDPIAAWPGGLVRWRDGAALLLLAPILVAAPRMGSGPAPSSLRRALAILALLAAAALTLLLLLYPAGIAYDDHAEPTVTMLAWWRLHGHLLYPDWDRGEGFYGLIYGPLDFQLIGWAIQVQHSVAASKLPGVLACGLGLLLMAAVTRRMAPGETWFRALLMGTVVLLLGAFGAVGFWNRPEPFLLLCTAAGGLAFARLRGVAAGVAIGLAAGIAAGFKLTAPLYFAGFALGLLASAPTRRARIAIALPGTLACAAAMALPFLDPTVTIAGYAKYFRMAAEHGQDPTLLALNALFGAVLLSPLLVLRWHNLAPAERWNAGGIVASVAVLAVVAAKPGAGPHHLLAFLPAFAWLCCRAHDGWRSAPGRSAAVAALFIALLATHGPAMLKQLRSVGGLVTLDDAREREKAAEVAALVALAPGAVMGQAGNAGYRDAYHRVQTAFHGSPAALLEVPAWMEMEKAGASRAIPEALLAGCAVRDWILPNAGAPFMLDGAYVHDRLETILSERFRTLFLALYHPARVGRYFTLWRCTAG